MAGLSSLFLLVCLTILKQTGAAWFSRNSITSLPDEMDHTIAACQEDNLMIQCRNRYNKIIIQDVFYGRDNLFTCTSKIFNATTLCAHPTPRNIIEKVHMMCNNENKCKVPATTTFLQKDGDGEFCFGIRKYLKVKYACHQLPQLHMVCPNDCSNSCWPMCMSTCCHTPNSPLLVSSPNATMNNTNHPSVILAVAHQEMIIHPSMPMPQCGGGCPSQCAPLCQPTCCKSMIPSLMMQTNTVSSCPGTCSGSCLPMCDPTCCLLRRTQQFNQPKPYPQIPTSCPGQCPGQCAPLCSPACCSGPSAMAPPSPMVTSCPVGCPTQCAPACQPSCCAPPPMMIMPPPPPPPPPTCGMGCPATCAPLCQPTCCQQLMAPPPPQPPPRLICPVGCPVSCLPMCQPTCCNQGGPVAPPPAYMAPPSAYMAPPAQMEQMMPMMSQQAMPGGCPPMCGPTMCRQPACPGRCCKREDLADPRSLDPYEVQQRRTYQQMLTHFRKKQLQRYFHGK